MSETRIAMWSGPRNISTAMMYSFNNRSDCHATDEPLYANFLLNSGIPHPDAEEVIENNETDIGAVITYLTGPIPGDKKLWYQKHMCHHILDGSDLSWIDGLTNCFLIRDPREVLLSLSKITDVPDLHVTGLPQQIRILDHVRSQTGADPPIIDSSDVLEDPHSTLSSLCDSIGLQFHEDMLSWDPGPKDCDGIWAKNWYSSVWESSGFMPYRPRVGELGPALSEVLEEAIPIYEELRSRRLIP
ncbi:MAG: sulfotransferase family protein [Euryarchaeota archaeon]|nr:sulfotransferase family protein [Euryarchaeota archaeon]